jgi:hypothetical protein
MHRIHSGAHLVEGSNLLGGFETQTVMSLEAVEPPSEAASLPFLSHLVQPWMAVLKVVGVVQVSFHSSKQVKKVKVPTKVNDIVNRLNRSKTELNPDLSAEKDAYDREVHC